MALALQEGGIGRNEWFSWVKGVSAFRAMPIEEVDDLVTWMLVQEILWEDEGVLWLGREGQDAYGRKNFLELFSVFDTPAEFTVLHGNRELGFVHETTFLVKQDAGPLCRSIREILAAEGEESRWSRRARQQIAEFDWTTRGWATATPAWSSSVSARFTG